MPTGTEGMGRNIDGKYASSAGWRWTFWAVIFMPWGMWNECPADTLLHLVVNGQEDTLDVEAQFGFETATRFEPRDFFDRLESNRTDCLDCVLNSVSFSISEPAPSESLWDLSFGAGEIASNGLIDLEVGSYDRASSLQLCTLAFGNNNCSQWLSLNYDSQSVIDSDVFSVSGRFDIIEAEYGMEGEVQRFAADFQQFNHLGDAVVVGQIRYNSEVPVAGLPGCDLNRDGVCDAGDVDEMTRRVIDGTSTMQGRTDFIEGPRPNRMFTYAGDWDSNGQFDEQDLVKALTTGQYMTGREAGFADGDADGDFAFTEQDLVFAFARGGYLQGPRAAAVPEPCGMVLFVLGAQLLWLRSRRTGSRVVSSGASSVRAVCR